MSRNNIYEFEAMSFVDEFPKVIYALNQLNKNVKTTEEVMHSLESAFLNQNEED